MCTVVHTGCLFYGITILDAWHLGSMCPIELKFSGNVDKGHNFFLLKVQT